MSGTSEHLRLFYESLLKSSFFCFFFRGKTFNLIIIILYFWFFNILESYNYSPYQRCMSAGVCTRLRHQVEIAVLSVFWNVSSPTKNQLLGWVEVSREASITWGCQSNMKTVRYLSVRSWLMRQWLLVTRGEDSANLIPATAALTCDSSSVDWLNMLHHDCSSVL